MPTRRTDDTLATYRAKRNFAKTPEPKAARGRRRKEPRFVIQQHDATAMHYDFRLEAGGVLKSWAVPRGPSTNPRDKRLAMPTEDHPMAYGSFEGVIPKGQYGAGPVIVWDAGTYRNLTERNGEEVPMEEALRRGHAKFWLEGHKLRGGWALTRTPVGGTAREKWLLVKLKDDEADARRNPVSTQPESVVSGRTIADMRRGGPA
ncbi:MAG TPA: DNA polymerase ligase N-terminal domain-containing protein [Actinomycetota bacterium]|nr:DNA polymerase ligase N-terminal domain-containing protein [Actinomycetota bacterium]